MAAKSSNIWKDKKLKASKDNAHAYFDIAIKYKKDGDDKLAIAMNSQALGHLSFVLHKVFTKMLKQYNREIAHATNASNVSR